MRFPLEGARTALLAVDLQNEFIGPSPLFPIPGADGLLSRLLPFLDAVRACAVQVVFTRYVTPEGENPSAARRHVIPQIASAHRGKDAELVAGIRPLAQDIMLDKPRQSAFYRTQLDDILKRRRVDCVLIAGVATNVCCLATAQSAAARDYSVVVLEDLTAASALRGTRGQMIPAQSVQDMTLAMIAHTVGEVDTSESVLARLRGGDAA